MVWGKGQYSSFSCGYTVVTAPFVKEANFPLLNGNEQNVFSCICHITKQYSDQNWLIFWNTVFLDFHPYSSVCCACFVTLKLWTEPDAKYSSGCGSNRTQEHMHFKKEKQLQHVEIYILTLSLGPVNILVAKCMLQVLRTLNLYNDSMKFLLKVS